MDKRESHPEKYDETSRTFDASNSLRIAPDSPSAPDLPS
jgi:hypothetical protein